METAEEFFRRFEHLTNAGETADLLTLFAPQFLVGGARGTHVLTPAVMAQVIPKRKEMTTALGCGKTILRSVVETKLDARYSSVRTEWAWEITRPAAEPFEVTVPSTYILERGDGLHIVAYFAHGDIVDELQRR